LLSDFVSTSLPSSGSMRSSSHFTAPPSSENEQGPRSLDAITLLSSNTLTFFFLLQPLSFPTVPWFLTSPRPFPIRLHARYSKGFTDLESLIFPALQRPELPRNPLLPSFGCLAFPPENFHCPREEAPSAKKMEARSSPFSNLFPLSPLFVVSSLPVRCLSCPLPLASFFSGL